MKGIKLTITVAAALLSLSIFAMAQQGTGAANNATNATGQTYGPNNNPGLNNMSATGQQNSQFGRDTATNAQNDATTDQTATDTKSKAKKKVNNKTDTNTNPHVKRRVGRTQTKTGTN